MWDKIGVTAKDILFPIYCFGCSREGTWLCDPCFSALDTSGVFCCSARGALSAEIALCQYEETSPIGRLVRAYKYGYASEIAAVFRKFIVRFAAERGLWLEGFAVIVPVPLHPRRLAERGFNQALALAAMLGETLGRPVADALARSRYTKPQARLSKEERHKNVADVFVGRHREAVTGRRVLLVDDIYSTGSTLVAAAKALRSAGAADIVGFTLARAV